MEKPLVIGDQAIELPVIQGGMGVGVSLSNLAGHVALCGGAGMISTAQIGYAEPGFSEDPIATNLKAIKKHLRRAKEIAKGNGIIGVNIMVATKKYEAYVRAAVQAGVDLIISGAGLPATLPSLVEKSKTKIAPIVSSLKSAKVIFKLWDRKYRRCPDLLVIEGPKAGGHLGFSYEQLMKQETLDFDREIQDIIMLAEEYSKKYGYSIPVAVAGGVYGRADMEKYLSLGADCVQIGTRFVTTYECDASQPYKQAYLDAKKEDIRIVKSPVGLPGRAVWNRFLQETEAAPKRPKTCRLCLERCDRKKIPYCITEALVNAVKGNVEKGLIFCGENAWRAEKMEHVADIMKEFS